MYFCNNYKPGYRSSACGRKESPDSIGQCTGEEPGPPLAEQIVPQKITAFAHRSFSEGELVRTGEGPPSPTACTETLVEVQASEGEAENVR